MADMKGQLKEQNNPKRNRKHIKELCFCFILVLGFKVFVSFNKQQNTKTVNKTTLKVTKTTARNKTTEC